MSVLKKLQHYKFTDKTIDNMIQALKNPNKRPNGIKTEAEALRHLKGDTLNWKTSGD